jgi:hypothetical protein
VKVHADLLLSGSASPCSVFTGAPTDWGAMTPSGSATAPGSATAALKMWVNEMGVRDWAGQYETLVSVQQTLISKERFVNCRDAGQGTWKWVGVVSTRDVATNDIPGTTASLPATFVKAIVQVSGLTVPYEAPIYNESGRGSGQ